ncbi:MAG: transposase [Deltaproteobacteria bacterium]|nr:transposase [Deltaproteobacteria bacterium]
MAISELVPGGSAVSACENAAWHLPDGAWSAVTALSDAELGRRCEIRTRTGRPATEAEAAGAGTRRALAGAVEARLYVPRDPTEGVLTPLVRAWWPRYLEAVEAEGGAVPGFVRLELERFMACGDPREGFVKLRCRTCGTERALAFSCKGRGLCPSCGARRMHDAVHHLVERVLPSVAIRQYVLSPPSELVALLAARGETLSALSRLFVAAISAGIRARAGAKLSCGAVVVLQRFTKTLTVYPHLHVLVLDGGYLEREDETLDFVEDTGPGPSALRALEARVEERFTRWLRRRGFLEEQPPEPEAEDGWWSEAAREPSGLLHAVSREPKRGFEVHASVRVAAGDEPGRERLCRYLMRPPFASAQLELVEEERVRLTLRSPARSGQRSIELHPLALMRRLAWLVPPPRQHQLRYAGVLAPAARLRSAVVPVGPVAAQGAWFAERAFEPLEPVPYRARWAQLLARVYDVDGQRCPHCAGHLAPVAVVLPPDAARCAELERVPILAPTGPPAQARLPFAT